MNNLLKHVSINGGLRMDKFQFDVVIIGGGPSGTAAGHILLENGINCCIIDKAKFPRKKLCGGLITQKTIEILNSLKLSQNIQDYYNTSTNEVKMYYKDNLAMDIKTKIPYCFTDRIIFDNLLVESFKSKGGKLFDGLNIENIDLDSKEIIITNKGIFKFKFIIGADGANSITRKFIDDKYKPNGFCLETNIPRDEFEHSNIAEIYFGIIKNGYGWIFPKKEHITVGIGGVFTKNIDYKKSFYEFLKIKQIKYDKLNIKGHFVPFGKYINKPIYDGKLLLVGDAAGLVDPIHGEGLYFSILSGKFAAETIVKSVESCDDSLLDYIEKIKPIHKIIDDGVWFQNIFYRLWFQTLIFPLAKGHNNIASQFCDNVVSYYNYGYKNITKLILDYKLKKYRGE